METIKLIKKFFHGHDIYWGETYFPNDFLNKDWIFLPLLFILLDKLIDNKEVSDSLYSYEIVRDKGAMFGFKVKSVCIFNGPLVLDIILKSGGISCLSDYLTVYQSDSNKGLQIKNFSDSIGDQVSHYEEGKVLKSDLELSFIFSDFELPVIKKDNSMKFSLNNEYPNLDPKGRAFFEELAVVAVADFLNKYSCKSISDVDDTLDVDERLILAAAMNHPVMMNHFADYFGCQYYQVRFDKSVYAIRNSIQNIADSRSFGEPTTTWYQLAKRKVSLLSFNTVLSKCFSAAVRDGYFDIDVFISKLFAVGHELIDKFKRENTNNNNAISSAITAKSIERDLNQKVVGQEQAVQVLSQGYLSSSIESQQGPRSIFTFAGPSGVGKTFLASQLLDVLNSHEKTGYVLNVFNMENYTDEKDVMKLFGSGVQYIDASLGMLTSKVRSQPRQILLFDEIEKAHSTVIQSLLTILDTGLVKDRTSQELVDFSQCIVIFTTNLGQELFASNPQNKEVCIFDVLKNSRGMNSKSQLSHEFVNRLAKGFAVNFNMLEVHHLMKIAERQIELSQCNSSGVSYCWPKTFAGFMLQTMASELSVRRISSCIAKFQSDILNKAVSYLSHDDAQVSFDIGIDDGESKDIKRNIIMLDKDTGLFNELAQLDSRHQFLLHEDVSSLHEVTFNLATDALLVNLDVLEQCGGGFTSFYSELGITGKLPIFTYRIVDKEVNLLNGWECHDVRRHFSINKDRTKQALLSLLDSVEYYSTVEQTLSKMKRRNEHLEYRCTVTKSGKTFLVNYDNLKPKQVVYSDDLNNGDLFKRTLPNVTMSDVVGLDRAKNKLSNVLGWLRSPEQLSQFGVKAPSGYLFSGPPGTGKTYLAKALAGESGMPFFSVSAADLVSAQMGGTAKNIKQLFTTARKYAPSIIFIDEIDAIAVKRSTSADSGDKERALTVNTLLTEMDGFESANDPVFVVAATNHPQLLDDAILRPGRFDEVIECDLPNRQTREHFFMKFIEEHDVEPYDNMMDDFVSTTSGLSAAEIDRVLRETVYLSVSESKCVTSELIKETMIKVCYGSPSTNLALSQKEKQRTAYHEAAHLLVSHSLFPERKIDFVTIEPRNRALGFVATREQEEYESFSGRRFKDQLEVLLAGRVAEKILMGCEAEISSGASNDISKATQLAIHAVYEAGLEPSVGPINVNMMAKYGDSELQKRAQDAVKQWIHEAQDRVEKRLNDSREKLEYIASQLLQKESLSGAEVRSILTRLELKLKIAM